MRVCVCVCVCVCNCASSPQSVAQYCRRCEYDLHFIDFLQNNEQIFKVISVRNECLNAFCGCFKFQLNVNSATQCCCWVSFVINLIIVKV